MNSTPKWYYKKKSNQLQIFKTLTLIFQKVRYLTKINTDLLKFNALGDYIKIIKEYESIFEAYANLKQEQQNTFSAIKKIKRSPYKIILIAKLNLLSNLNNRRFQQLIFVLKKMLFFSFQKSTDSTVLITWGLELVSMYNRCSRAVNELQTNGLNSNVCSNTYPNLLLPQASFDFGIILQLVSHRRIEQNILDVLLRLLNMGEFHEISNEHDSSASSLEVLKILTHNIVGESDYLKHTSNDNMKNDSCCTITSASMSMYNKQQHGKTFRNNNIENFLYKESIYLSNLISECQRIVPSIFDEKENHSQKLNYDMLLKGGLKTVWTYISTVLDHVILWWIETPMSCYSLSHVDSIRNWIFSDGFNETKEPVHSSLKALCEILTIFVSNNVWDQMFRITLVTSSHSRNARMEDDGESLKSGTNVGKVWSALFNHLRIFNNNFLLASEGTSGQLAVAEQISILHRIDHSIHSMRIWVNEQSKLQSSQWVIDVVFQVLNYDVRECLNILSLIDSRKLTMEQADVLMTVCISLRAKLLLEINANILKLKNTSDECIHVLSSVCRTLSLANFSLCFPPRQHWNQNVVNETKSAYVSFVLDQIFLPALKSTNDIVILELILKLICEAWIDYIYSQRIKFTTCGALALLNDFDEVREWISKVPYLATEHIKKLSNHEVLRMCKGVGKVLVRKPKEMISIVHSPKHIKSSFEESSQETRLPSEMFVSNQSHWLQLRATSGKMSFLVCCTEN